jgi:hypothetical protein
VGLFEPRLTRFSGIPGNDYAVNYSWISGYMTASTNEILGPEGGLHVRLHAHRRHAGRHPRLCSLAPARTGGREWMDRHDRGPPGSPAPEASEQNAVWRVRSRLSRRRVHRYGDLVAVPARRKLRHTRPQARRRFRRPTSSARSASFEKRSCSPATTGLPTVGAGCGQPTPRRATHPSNSRSTPPTPRSRIKRCRSRSTTSASRAGKSCARDVDTPEVSVVG